MKYDTLNGREILRTWPQVADFFGVTVRALYKWRDRDKRFRKMLKKYKGNVVVFVDDAAKYRDECLLQPYG